MAKQSKMPHSFKEQHPSHHNTNHSHSDSEPSSKSSDAEKYDDASSATDSDSEKEEVPGGASQKEILEVSMLYCFTGRAYKQTETCQILARAQKRAAEYKNRLQDIPTGKKAAKQLPTKEDTSITHYAKKYALLGVPFLSKKKLCIKFEGLTTPLSEHYKTRDSANQALLAELHSFLPPNLVILLKKGDPDFVHKVRTMHTCHKHHTNVIS